MVLRRYRGFTLLEVLEVLEVLVAVVIMAVIMTRTSTQPPRWHRRWDADAQSFPDLIRVRMQVNDGEQPWPDLYLALPAGRGQ